MSKMRLYRSRCDRRYQQPNSGKLCAVKVEGDAGRMVGSFSAVTDVGDRREVSSLFIRTSTVKVMAYLRGDVALGRGVVWRILAFRG